MSEDKARKLASAICGDIVRTTPPSPSWGVALTLADGRYCLIEEDAGAVYFDEHACWTGYMVNGSDPKGNIEAEEWIIWDGSEHWAQSLSGLLGSPEYWHSGGGIWLVLFTRRDGQFVVIGSEGASVYQNREQWERDDESGENLIWV